MRVAHGFDAHGVAACYDEASGGGENTDWDALRNRPAKDPTNWLSNIYWHSEFTQYELAVDPIVVVITHTALNTQLRYYSMQNGFTGSGSSSPPTTNYMVLSVQGARRVTDLVLNTHNLGYKPHYMIAVGNGTIGNGTLIQATASGHRSVSPYVTNTQIGLLETAFAGASNLASTAITYGILLFRNPAQDPAKPLFGKAGTHVILGRGRIDSQYKYLRRVSGAESSVDLNVGPTIDYGNGGSKQVIGNVSQVVGNYQGDFSGTDYVPVDASQ